MYETRNSPYDRKSTQINSTVQRQNNKTGNGNNTVKSWRESEIGDKNGRRDGTESK